MNKRNLLFVCTGNTCRSPFAEGMMRKLIDERFGESGSYVRVTSAGTYAFSGVKPPPDAQRAAAKFGVDISGHKSRSIHLSMMEAADVVFGMTSMHKAHLVARFPWFEDKIFILKKYALGLYEKDKVENSEEIYDIPDPIGHGLNTYQKVFEQISGNLEKVIDQFEKEKKFRKEVAKTYRIVAGSDHAGFTLKDEMVKYMRELGHDVDDFGTGSEEKSVDYPDFARPAAEAVAEGKYDFGLVCCGSGIGVSITCNRVKKARAVLAREEYSARMARRHNKANILCMGGRFTTPDVGRQIVKAFLETEFDGGRHNRRVKKIDNPKTGR